MSGSAILRRKAPISSVLMMIGIILVGFLNDKTTIQFPDLRFISLLFTIAAVLIVLIHYCNLSKSFVLFYFIGIILMLTRINYYDNCFEFDIYKEYNGIVTNIDDEEWGLKLTCRIDVNESGYCLLNYIDSNNPDTVEIGDRIRFSSILSKPDEQGNPRTFDYRKSMYSKGISAVGRIYSYEITDRDTSLYYIVKAFLHLKKVNFIDRFFTEKESGALAKGILFGDTDSIEDDVYKAFTYMGTAHILAVSGLHIGVLYGFYSLVLTRIKLKRRIIGAVFALFLILYGIVADWSPSVTRAIMLVFFKMIADSNSKKYDILSSLSIINVIMLMVNPYVLFSIGFQLSFLSALGLSVVTPRYKSILHDIIRIPITLQFFLLPYMIRVYNQFSILGIFANIVSVLIVSFYVPLGVITFFVYLIIREINSTLIETIITSMGRMLIEFNDVLFKRGIENIVISSPNLFWVVLLILLSLFIHSELFALYIERRNHRKILFILLLIGLISTGAYIYDKTPFDDAAIVFIDVGQGDSIHIKDNTNGNILIDGGGRPDYNVGEKILRPYLLHNGVNKINMVLTTHEHMDHYKGIQELNESFAVGDHINNSVMGDTIKISTDIHIKVLWPRRNNAASDDENYYSRIYMIDYKGVKTLITGDITEEGERALIEEYHGSDELKCDVLKVAHHGSRFSSCKEFLDATGAKVAVISAGKNNSYGHPSEDVLERLKAADIIVYRTDIDGAVGIIMEEGGFKVCTNKTNKEDVYNLSVEK